MIYRTVSLYDLMRQKVGKETINKILSNFSCPLNSDVEYFIQHKAYDFERVGLARTYLVYAQQSAKDIPVLAAIYSLGQSNVEISSDLSRKMKKKVFGTSYPMGKNIKTLLIGQLAKNYKNGSDKYITGDLLMRLVFERIKEIHMIFPSVVTHIDCKNISALRRYYEKFGFSLFKQKDDMLIYLIPTQEIMRFLNTDE